MTTPAVRLGAIELVPLSDGFFRLDGGAMFGIIPKPLWERRIPADARNRIRLGLRPLLVRGERTVLVDAGTGDKLGRDARQADIYGLERDRHLDDALRAAGTSAEEIDLVLASHLHFDHAGGFTEAGPDGRARPRFPRARYLVRRGEWDDATHPHERNRGSYLPDDFVPLAEAGVLDLFDDDREIVRGVRVVRTGGHTRAHQIVVIEDGGRTAVFAADLLPTTAHVGLPWIMAYDLYPVETLEFKRRFLQEAIAREYLIFFEHDPAVIAGIVRERDGRPVVEPVLVDERVGAAGR
ncbi:MAG TPA: MBL fold metallo-hydrolase [Vicinamibacterales bacterium]|nr:MBL fold metallo-hydrolase [Vicinamibacterales bacterium]